MSFVPLVSLLTVLSRNTNQYSENSLARFLKFYRNFFGDNDKRSSLEKTLCVVEYAATACSLLTASVSVDHKIVLFVCKTLTDHCVSTSNYTTFYPVFLAILTIFSFFFYTHKKKSLAALFLLYTFFVLL